MNFKTFIKGITGILTLFYVKVAHAQVLGGSESIISPPVGDGILPGSGASGESIQESILFAKIIPFAIQYLIGLTAAVSVLAIIFAGYQYWISYGDSEKDLKARKTLIYAVLGLILSITAFGIVRIITSIQLS